MPVPGWTGALGGKKIRTTIAAAECPAGWSGRPGLHRPLRRTSCGSRTSPVATWSGKVYAAFLFDVFWRRVVGWRATTSMSTELVLDHLERGIWSRARDGARSLAVLVHHPDAGSQGGFNWLSQHLEFMEVFHGSSTAGSRPSGSSEVEVAGSSEVPAPRRGRVSGRDRAKGLRLSGCRSRSGRGGSPTLAACHRSI
jgi:putative transposase